MVHSFVIAAASSILLASAAAVPPPCHDFPPAPTGPKVDLIFFSDDKCTQTVPSSNYVQDVFAGPCTDNFPEQFYKSVIIFHIDDQFIGTNSALQIGNSNDETCNFTNSIKIPIATRDDIGICQFIGIPQKGPGKPLLVGNEYQLTTLQ